MTNLIGACDPGQQVLFDGARIAVGPSASRDAVFSRRRDASLHVCDSCRRGSSETLVDCACVCPLQICASSTHLLLLRRLVAALGESLRELDELRPLFREAKLVDEIR